MQVFEKQQSYVFNITKKNTTEATTAVGMLAGFLCLFQLTHYDF